jgi:hypothetical protein
VPRNPPSLRRRTARCCAPPRANTSSSPLETWRAENSELLISPDGLRRLRLYRNADGTVDRIALETDRMR